MANFITDTINEIKGMKIRKVSPPTTSRFLTLEHWIADADSNS